jgi:hypothetical protein
MEIIAWIGVGILGLLVAIILVIWTVGMLKELLGRAILLGLSLTALVVWGVLGGIYLVTKAV